MSGDYSRKTFKAKHNYSGVLMQQGRVQLDADWNEQIAITQRRKRAETVDTIGRAVVPMETPDGFKVAFSKSGLNIYPGRLYVDGLLAENHGAIPLEFCSVLDEERGSQPVLYNNQPYFPNIDKIAPLPDSGSGLAYLDVWQREVTYVKQPDLVEPAVGVDTTARWQTVWQVKVLDIDTTTGGAALECSDQVDVWDKLIAPSAGRLSTDIVATQEEDNVCLIPTEGGYRALENRLYRVEVHTGGDLDTAKFKWSRHNASIESAVQQISGAELTVAQVQWDAIRRFYIGDWVEVTDNVREFSGIAGEMRQIDNVDYAQNIVTLDVALSAADFPTDEINVPRPDRYTRIKRWDQKNDVDVTSGLVAVADSPVYLEDGIQISFDLDPSPTLSGKFKIGDYWNFYARSATAKIEILDNSPPRGIYHHYARLAVLSFQDQQQDDCREHWPPDFGHANCCTIAVGDGKNSFGQYNSIQEAVNQLPTAGGKICVLPGRYAEHVIIKDKENIIISGCGEPSVIIGINDKEYITKPIVRIENSANIRIEHLSIDSLQEGIGIFMQGYYKTGLNAEGLVAAVPSSCFELNKIILDNLDINSGKGSAIHCENGSHVNMLGSRVHMRNESDSAPGIYAFGRDVLIANNSVSVIALIPESGLEHTETAIKNMMASGGIQIGGMSERIKIHNNVIKNGIGDGISLGSMQLVDKDDLVVVKSYVMLVKTQDPCVLCEAPSIKLRGKVPRELSVPMISRLRKMPGLSKNEISIIDRIRDTTEPLIQLSAGDLIDIDIVGNQIENMGRNGVSVYGFFDLDESDEFISIENLTISNNHIEACLNSALPAIASDMEDDMGYGGIALADVLNLRIHDNNIFNNGVNPVDPVCGIYVLHGEGVEICDNRIVGNGKKGDDVDYKVGPRSGIHLVYAVAPTVSISFGKEFSNLPRQNGIPAAKIHNNIVTHAVGRALTINALGPVVVTDNQFTSRGVIEKAESSNVSTVSILNLGLSNELYFQIGGFAQLAKQEANLHSINSFVKADSPESVTFLNSNLDDFKLGRYLANGNVMFTNNQVVLDELDTNTNGIVSATRILSMDDIGCSNNQFDYSLLGDFIIFPNVLFAPSLRITDNRFKESLAGAVFSVLAFGIMNTTTNNQATHCIISRGFPGLEVVRDNIELFDVLTGGNNETICAKINEMIKA